MAIAEGLAAKVGLSLGVAGIGGTSLYFGNNYLNDYVYISKYERALITFLQDDDKNDIIFEVKKGEDGSADLSADDITFSGTGNTSPVKIKVKVSLDSSSSLKKGDTSNNKEASDINKIKELGENSNWTWECSFNFTLDNNSNTGKTIKDKDRIWKNSDKGLFGILKKDLNSYTPSGSWTNKDLKQVKVDFIRQCGNQRSVSTNKTISEESKKATNTEIKIPDIDIKFVASGNDLVPEEEAVFDYWFKDKFKDWS